MVRQKGESGKEGSLKIAIEVSDAFCRLAEECRKTPEALLEFFCNAACAKETPEGGKNIAVDAEVPPDFLNKAAAAGVTPQLLLWRLAEDFCANAPKSVEVVVLPKRCSLAISDKVILHGWYMPADFKTAPRLKRERVYCVSDVCQEGGRTFICLAGVYSKPAPGKLACLNADAFTAIA